MRPFGPSTKKCQYNQNIIIWNPQARRNLVDTPGRKSYKSQPCLNIIGAPRTSLGKNLTAAIIMTRLSLLALLYPAVLCAGCASTPYSDQRLKIDTGDLLGVPAGQIEISDKRSTDATTTYTAKTKSAEYSCTISGGSVMKSVINMGISPVPTCIKKDQPPGG